MERKLQALRDVLLYVEDHFPFDGQPRQLVPGEISSELSEEEVLYAVYLAMDRGYLDGSVDPQIKYGLPVVRAITDRGHEFLELTRNPNVRSQLLQVAEETGIYSIDALKPLAVRLAQEELQKALKPDPA